jgi:hypothetical protein
VGLRWRCARAAWLGGQWGGSIVVALMRPSGKSGRDDGVNRGFRIEQGGRAEQSSISSLHFADVHIHVLVASNALYAKMIAAARSVTTFTSRREDLALL